MQNAKTAEERTINLLQDAILALQSGQHGPLNEYIDQRANGKTLKDKLWCIFRASATNFSILDQID